MLGPKGGTGKTLTSREPRGRARAARARSVAIVDLDLQFGDVALCLGLPPERTIYDLALAGGTLDAEKLDALPDDALDRACACCSRRPGPTRRARHVELLRDVYAVAALARTTSSSSTRRPGFTAEVIATIDAATDLVMVGMLDALSLKNTKLGLETLELMGYDPRMIQLVLNRAAQPRRHQPAATSSRVLGREPDIFIPSDREIPRAVNEGVPIVPRAPAVGGGRSVSRARRLSTTARAAAEPHVVRAPRRAAHRGRRRLFGRKS